MARDIAVQFSLVAVPNTRKTTWESATYDTEVAPQRIQSEPTALPNQGSLRHDIFQISVAHTALQGILGSHVYYVFIKI